MSGKTLKIMLASLAAVFMLVAAFAVVGGAEEVQADSNEGICGDGLYWSVEDGVLTVTKVGTGTGVMNDYMNIGAPWAPLGIERAVIGEGVTAIGNVAFAGIETLKSVSFPSTLKVIEDYAFIDSGLEAVVLPYGLERIGDYCFGYCESLGSVFIPSTLTEVASGAFYGCCELETVEIAVGVKSIGSVAFGNCESLKHVAILDKDAVIDEMAFWYSAGFYDINDNRLELEDVPGYTYEGSDGKLVRQQSRGDFETGICGDGLIWTLYADGSLFINYTGVGTGVMTDFTSDNKPGWYGKNVLSATIGDGVKSIGDYAFRSCKSLSDVEIANTVESIGEGAFYLCSSLVSIDIPASVREIGYGAFINCGSLVSIYIAGPIEKIEADTFYGCGLIAIEIPATVTAIEEEAFAACESLEVVMMHSGLKSIGACAFAACYVINYISIPATVTEIGEYPFEVEFYDSDGTTMLDPYTEIAGYTFERVSGKLIKQQPRAEIVDQGICGDGVIWIYYDDQTLVLSYTGEGTGATYDYDYKDNITPWYADDEMVPLSIVVEEGVTSLGSYVLAYCGKATSIQLPESLVSMGDHALAGCASMKSFDFPANVTEIPSYCFAAWMGLSEITIPGTITTVGDGAFTQCMKLSSIVFEPGVKYIGKEVCDWCWNLESVTLSEGLLSIGESAFAKSDITEIVFPSTLETIGDSAFDMCGELETVKFSEGLRHIGARAFYDCEMTALELPYGLVFIGEQAFNSCSKVTSISIPSSVAVIGDKAFSFFFEQHFYDYDGVTELTVAELPGYYYEGTPMDHTFVRISVTVDGTGPCGSGVSWVYWGDNDLQIMKTEEEGSGRMVDYSESVPAPWIGYGYTAVYISEEVTYIGSNAFTDMSNVVYMSITSTVTSIGNAAFYGSVFYVNDVEVEPTAENLAGSNWYSSGDCIFHKEILYTVTFDAMGGDCAVDSMQTAPDHTLADLPVPEKDGYEFRGWYTKETGGELITTSTVFNEDTTVYAHWSSGYTIPEKIVIYTVIGIALVKELFRWF